MRSSAVGRAEEGLLIREPGFGVTMESQRDFGLAEGMGSFSCQWECVM